MIPRSIGWLFGSLAWIGGIYASVSLRYLDFSDGHTVCGPWGCGGSIEDLAAVHAAWCVAIMPLVAFIIRRKKQIDRWSSRFGNIALFSAILVFLAVNLHTLLVWIPATPEHLRGYFWQRIGFVIVNMVDVPLIQLAIAGIAIRLANLGPRSIRRVSENA